MDGVSVLDPPPPPPPSDEFEAKSELLASLKLKLLVSFCWVWLSFFITDADDEPFFSSAGYFFFNPFSI